MSSVSGPLSSNRLATLLNQTHSSGKPQGYICHHSVTNVYNVYFKPKQSRQYEPGFTPLSFREILFLGYSLYNELCKYPDEAKIVSNEIHRMNERKIIKERHRGYFFQVSKVISDCSKNLFKGYGFKTTSQLAMELTWDLAQIAAKAPKPMTPPPIIAPTPVISLPVAPEVKTLSVPTVLTNRSLETPLSSQLTITPAEPIEQKKVSTKAEIAIPQKTEPAIPVLPTVKEPVQVKSSKNTDVPHRVNFSDPPAISQTETPPKPVQKQLLPAKSSPNLSSTIVSIPTPTPHNPAPQPSTEETISSAPRKFSEPRVVNYSNYTRLPDRPPPLQRSSSRIGKKDALKAYKEDPINCPNICKTSIWLEINEVDNERPLNEECITTVVHLMQFVSGSKDLDLKNEKCGQVVIDTFNMGKKVVCSNLVQWLKKKRSFNPPLLGKCLTIFIQKAQDGGSAGSLTYEPLIQLLQIYRDRDWNSKVGHHSHHHKDNPDLPINSPILVDALRILLVNQPNHEFGGSFVEWASGEHNFDAPTFLKLIRIYKDHEELKGANLNDLYYPTRDKLIEFIKTNTEIKGKVLADANAIDVLVYLRKKGVQI